MAQLAFFQRAGRTRPFATGTIGSVGTSGSSSHRLRLQKILRLILTRMRRARGSGPRRNQLNLKEDSFSFVYDGHRLRGAKRLVERVPPACGGVALQIASMSFPCATHVSYVSKNFDTARFGPQSIGDGGLRLISMTPLITLLTFSHPLKSSQSGYNRHRLRHHDVQPSVRPPTVEPQESPITRCS